MDYVSAPTPLGKNPLQCAATEMPSMRGEYKYEYDTFSGGFKNFSIERKVAIAERCVSSIARKALLNPKSLQETKLINIIENIWILYCDKLFFKT